MTTQTMTKPAGKIGPRPEGAGPFEIAPFAEWALPRWLRDWWAPDWMSGFDHASTMRVEEFEDADDLVIRVEMPGLDPDHDVQLSLQEDMLHIRAERRESTERTDKGRYRSEFRYGSFMRTLPVPPGTDDTDVRATYADGILEIRVPAARERPEARRIPVSRA